MILFYKSNLKVNKTNERTQVQNGGRSVELENPLIMPTSVTPSLEPGTSPWNWNILNKHVKYGKKYQNQDLRYLR